MGWTGKFFGALIGFLLIRTVWGAVTGALIGHFFDQNMAAGFSGGRTQRSLSDVFFRTTFELMGHVAKADGRISEAEIGAARGLMAELRLGPIEIDAAIACFGRGKEPGYDANKSVEDFRAACGQRHDLLLAFMELQLRAALAGNGMSLPSRAILTRVGERFGMSGLEFAHLEASLRARQQAGSGQGGRAYTDKPLAECYRELAVESGASDQEVTKAYRRQMSRHHPDKLVANGLPESMAQVAKEKTQRIQEAYEAIREARGMR